MEALQLADKKRILIAEDDPALAETVARILNSKNFLVSHAKDGKEAKELIALDDFDLVISDIRMPNVNGIELLHFIKKNAPTVPVILMTGFAEITETKEAYDLGAKGFLPKPFSKSLLLSTIDEVIEKKITIDESIEQDLDDLYTGVKIDEFITGKELQFDIFIRINKSKYIKVANGGESIDINRIKNYHASGLNYLFLKKQDFINYTGFTISLTEKVKQSNLMSHQKKVQVIQQATKSVLEGLYHESLNKEKYELSMDVIRSSVGIISESSQALEVFEMLKNHSNNLFAHSLAVSIYATMIAQQLGWTSLKSRVTVSMCGLFHDIGLKEIPIEILNKSRVMRTQEEIKIFETHTNRGMEILNSIPSIPLEVSQVALSHHEDCQGLGYPMHLTKNKTSPLSQLIFVANEFCDLVRPIHNQFGMTPDSAIQKMLASDLGRYEPTFLNGLKALIKH